MNTTTVNSGSTHLVIESTVKLQAQSFDLWGSRLIEASAGTGKTWTIAALYVRLVLGHGAEHGFGRALRPAEILVMTFTKAATRELSDRIRERLLAAARWFRGDAPQGASDPFLESLVADYASQQARDHAAWLLTLAAQSMDEASVHTIDAWCQRMLKEHAFDSGCLFDEELVADEEAMRLEAAQDYWRRYCYPLAPDELDQVLKVWSGVDRLAQDMRAILGQGLDDVATHDSLAEVLQHTATLRTNAVSQLKSGWAQRADTMQAWLDAQTSANTKHWEGRRLSAKHYSNWLRALKAWAADTGGPDVPELKTGWQRLTPQGLMEVRKPDAPAIELPGEFCALVQLRAALDGLPSVRDALRRHAATQVARRLLVLKQRSGSFGFADMLNRLHAALQGAHGGRLRERILAQYPVALIDEFQDTSPLQYQIFDRIYQTQNNDRNSALLLIGDPKQSIYGFRGADIYSYMAARKATSGRHYVLETNFRSTQAVVDAVNHWFGEADAAHPEGAFMFRNGSDNPLPFIRVGAHGRDEQLVTSDGSVPAMTLVHDLQPQNARLADKTFSGRCAEQIVALLNDPAAGFAGPEQAWRSLRPADIAILVRTGKQATDIRNELARRGVASVYLSDKDSVLASSVARDLLHWLRAVAAPQDVRLARAGLATGLIGLSLGELATLAVDDAAFDARSLQLRALRTVWQTQGVLAMLRQTLHQLDLAAQWLKDPEGERKLTNFLHLAELLQAASGALEGEQALIRWLHTELQEGTGQNEEQVVRLESDADLVKVITIHKSKGLEYPLVFLPFATYARTQDRKNTTFVNIPDAQGTRTLRLTVDDEALALADRDRLREDLRLLYVALTRARHALWIGFSAITATRSDKCAIHESACGYLVGGPLGALLTHGPDWLAPLQQWAAGCPHIELKAAPPDTACTRLAKPAESSGLVDSPDYRAEFERNWKIGSFSQLVRDLSSSHVGSQLSTLQLARPADDEPDGPDTAATAAAERTQTSASAPAWHQFAKGAEAGNFLHDQLEWLASEGFALPGNDTLAQRLQRRCERAGRGLHTQVVQAWLTEVVQTRLPGPQASLMEISAVLPEMEFWLPAGHLQASAMDAQCRAHVLAGVERPALAERQLHGMLMGFADLVFEYQGRYWVLDYKSNYLGPDDSAYSSDALAHAMAQHRYDVQAAIYLLALHRLLRSRLGAQYEPQQHLGGAVYLFLRGVRGPQQGVCWLPASLPLLDALDTMLDKEGAPV